MALHLKYTDFTPSFNETLNFIRVALLLKYTDFTPSFNETLNFVFIFEQVNAR